jgi:hypothetical protein
VQKGTGHGGKIMEVNFNGLQARYKRTIEGMGLIDPLAFRSWLREKGLEEKGFKVEAITSSMLNQTAYYGYNLKKDDEIILSTEHRLDPDAKNAIGGTGAYVTGFDIHKLKNYFLTAIED